MYTNIETDHALAVIAEFLQTSLLCVGCSHSAIIQGLKILMLNNLFQFLVTPFGTKQKEPQ
jgi:hypothetical protein